MLPCVRCGEETELLVLGAPLCLKCDAAQEAEISERERRLIERKLPGPRNLTARTNALPNSTKSDLG